MAGYFGDCKVLLLCESTAWNDDDVFYLFLQMESWRNHNKGEEPEGSHWPLWGVVSRDEAGNWTVRK